MNNDQPRKILIKELMGFIDNNKSIYVFGRDHDSQMLVKYLDMCEVEVAGVLVDEQGYLDLKDGCCMADPCGCAKEGLIKGKRYYTLNEAASTLDFCVGV